jgi:zinc D-Ala-D-Ala carboxypeptidase
MGDLSRDFSRSEFSCKCGCGLDNVSPLLVEKLQRMRNVLRIPVVIHSGLRCPTYNATVGGEPNSAHLTGEAADVRCIASSTRYRMKRTAHTWALFNRIGNGDTFLHFDVSKTLPQEVEWNYPKGREAGNGRC